MHTRRPSARSRETVRMVPHERRTARAIARAPIRTPRAAMPNRCESVRIREVGLRDGLQSIAAHAADRRTSSSGCARRYDAGLREIEVGSFVPPQAAAAAGRHRRAGRARAARCPGLAASVLVPNLKGAERGDRRAAPTLMLLPLSASHAHSLANLRKTPDEVVDEIGAHPRPARRARLALRDRGRHEHRVRLHDPGPRRARRGAAPRRGACSTPAPSASAWPTPSAMPTRCRWSACSRRRFAVAGERLALRALPRHARPRPGQRLRRVAGRACAASTPASAASAAARTRRARAATSRPKTWPTCSPAWASPTGARLRSPDRACARASRHGSTARRCTARCGAPGLPKTMARRVNGRTPERVAAHGMPTTPAGIVRSRWRACASSSSPTW